MQGLSAALEGVASAVASWVESSYRLECPDDFEGTDDAGGVSRNVVGAVGDMGLASGSLESSISTLLEIQSLESYILCAGGICANIGGT